MYIGAPFTETKVKRIMVALELYLEDANKKYHHMEKGPEKEEVGMMIHDLNAALSCFQDKTYRKPWREFGKFFYPSQYNEDGSSKHEK